MNNVRLLTYKVLRTYGTKAASEIAGIRGKVQLTKMNKSYAADFEKFDQDDMSVYESNFMEITKDFISHKREEEKVKEQLKRNIVKSKVFKDREPRFLTYVEKNIIQKLHESDSEEWTPEKLSQSFPALPETIKRILKAKWEPKSVEQVLRYDNKVIENWKQFKNGKLAVSPALKEHLMQFKKRRIPLVDRETLIERFIPPKIELPKPKSSFFSSIVKDVTKEEPIKNEKLLISSQGNNKKEENNLSTMLRKDGIESNKKKVWDERLNFEEFLKKKLNSPEEISAEEKVVLVDIYKKHKKSNIVEDISSNVYDTKETKETRVTAERESCNSIAVRKVEPKAKIMTEVNPDHASLETHVKERVSYMDVEFDYSNCIRIPKNLYQKGKTYRIKDCYYDYDGEFLYRVPGLKT